MASTVKAGQPLRTHSLCGMHMGMVLGCTQRAFLEGLDTAPPASLARQSLLPSLPPMTFSNGPRPLPWGLPFYTLAQRGPEFCPPPCPLTPGSQSLKVIPQAVNS